MLLVYFVAEILILWARLETIGYAIFLSYLWFQVFRRRRTAGRERPVKSSKKLLGSAQKSTIVGFRILQKHR